MIHLRKREKHYHVDYAAGVHRLRGSLGTANRDAAMRLKGRLENAMAEGPESPLWSEIRKTLPQETYTRFSKYSGVSKKGSTEWVTLRETFETWLDQRVQLGKLRESSRDRYLITLRAFSDYLDVQKIDFLDQITRPVVEAWKSARLKNILAKPQSRGGGGMVLDVAILHKVFTLAVEHEMITKNPVKMEGRPGDNPQGGAEPFTADELRRLREHAGIDEFGFKLLRWTGFRGSDIVDLRWSDVNFDKREIERLTQKRRKVVVVPMHQELLAALKEEYDRRQPAPADHVFLHPIRNKPTKRPRLYDRIQSLGKRARVDGARPHRFRDTLAVDMLQRGASIWDVAKILGDDVDTVVRHYSPFTTELRDRVRGFLDGDNGLEGKA